jgi:hypothetical protein
MSSRLLDARSTAKAWLCVLSGVRSAITVLTFGYRSREFLHQYWVSSATAITTTAMYPNNDTLGERLKLYVEENFHDA